MYLYRLAQADDVVATLRSQLPGPFQQSYTHLSGSLPFPMATPSVAVSRLHSS